MADSAGHRVVNEVVRSYHNAPRASNHQETYLATIQEILALLRRLLSILEKCREPVEDDFMRGWGEPGGGIEP